MASMGDAARYGSRGVSSAKGDVHKAIAGLDAGLFPTAFCKIVPDSLAGSPDHCVVMHADGAGTKSALAYAYWRETGDLSVWHGVAQDAIVMNIDDLLCVGATDGILLSSTIGRNARLVPGEVIAAIIEGTELFCERLRSHGIGIELTGGETADVGDLVRTVIVDSTVVARMRRDRVIANDRIAPGDVVVGLASFGQSTYEDSYNAGIGSNGLTSARHDLFGHQVGERYPETFDPLMPSELAYCGPLLLTEQLPNLPRDAGRILLSPTRTFAPIIRAVLAEMRERIHALVHCSGGGQTKVLRFAKGVRIVKDNLFPLPPLFRLLQESSGTTWEEMYRIYNMGHRMEVYLSPSDAERVLAHAAAFGVEARVIGHVEASPNGNTHVELHGEGGVYHYQL